MNSPLYQEILIDFLAPYCAEHFQVSDVVLHQDNDPKHTSILCRKTLSRCGIRWIKSPSKSPDLNPIELLWKPMKDFVRARFCKNPNDVLLAILDWKETVENTMCRKIIDTLKTNIQIVIKKKGGWSNH